MKKDNVIYVILVLIGFEHIRVEYNKIEDRGRKLNLSDEEIERKQKRYISNVSMGLATISPLVLILSKFNELTSSSGILPGVLLILSYVFTCFFLSFFFSAYIDRMNNAKDFFKRLQRSAWDGSKIVLEKTGEASAHAIRKTRGAAANVFKKTWGLTRTGAGWTRDRAVDVSKKVGGVVSALVRKRGKQNPASPLNNKIENGKPEEINESTEQKRIEIKDHHETVWIMFWKKFPPFAEKTTKRLKEGIQNLLENYWGEMRKVPNMFKKKRKE